MNGMKNGILAAFAFFAITVLAGYYAGGRSWNGVVYLADGSISSSSRHPAAIKRELDFSRLDGAELITATQKRLVTAAKTILKDGLLGIELGHFVTRDGEGQRRLACDSLYNRLNLHFEAEGMAAGGEKPTMEIDSPCATSQTDISSIEPIWIPVSQLLKSPAKNSDTKFENDVHFKFDNMSGTWPVRWSLQSVRLYNDGDATNEVKISSRELREFRQRPFVVNWMEGRLPSSSRKH